MKANIVYGFFYQDCIYEGSELISLHKTKVGAEMALMYFKDNGRQEWDMAFAGDEDAPTFGEHSNWYIEEIEIND